MQQNDPPPPIGNLMAFLRLVDPTADRGLRALITIGVVGILYALTVIFGLFGLAMALGGQNAGSLSIATITMWIANLWLLAAVGRIAWVLAGVIGLGAPPVRAATAVVAIVLVAMMPGLLWSALVNGLPRMTTLASQASMAGRPSLQLATVTADVKGALDAYLAENAPLTPELADGGVAPAGFETSTLGRTLMRENYVSLVDGVMHLSPAAQSLLRNHWGELRLGRYTVNVIEDAKQLDPPSAAMYRVRFLRQFRPNALGRHLLDAGWSSPGRKIVNGQGGKRDDAEPLGAPAGFNRDALGLLESTAVMQTYDNQWTVLSIDAGA